MQKSLLILTIVSNVFLGTKAHAIPCSPEIIEEAKKWRSEATCAEHEFNSRYLPGSRHIEINIQSASDISRLKRRSGNYNELGVVDGNLTAFVYERDHTTKPWILVKRGLGSLDLEKSDKNEITFSAPAIGSKTYSHDDMAKLALGSIRVNPYRMVKIVVRTDNLKLQPEAGSEHINRYSFYPPFAGSFFVGKKVHVTGRIERWDPGYIFEKAFLGGYNEYYVRTEASGTVLATNDDSITLKLFSGESKKLRIHRNEKVIIEMVND